MQEESWGGNPDKPSGPTAVKIDIEPYRKIGNDKSLMDILLFDHTTESNLIWATNDYESRGSGFGLREQIQYLFIINPNKIIRPRYLKSIAEQKNRSRDTAEVFTPPWIVNKQNNLVDEQWTGVKDPFNIEDGNDWVPSERVDLGDHDWREYVSSIRMEVCCGEAPYLTTRYDSTDGTVIPVNRRVGILDRKLRVISENIDSKLSWLDWAKIAVKNIYGYDLQGDNVLLARENLLLSVMEFFEYKFGEEIPRDKLMDICHILSWNIWQMDGMRMVVPFSCDKEFSFNGVQRFVNNCPACKTGKGKHYGKSCKIWDWEKDTSVVFASLMGKEKIPKPTNGSKGMTLDRFLGE